jgi:hypothetical protein
VNGCKREERHAVRDREHQHGYKHEEYLSGIGRKEEGEALTKVVEHATAFLDRGDDGSEVVVGQHDVRRVTCRRGARHAHGHPDVRLTQRGGVVHAVAGHRSDFLARLERLHEAELVLRGDSREHVHAGSGSDERGVIERLQLRAGEDGPVRAQSDVLRDRSGRAGMISGDHFHRDARSLTCTDRPDRRVARRVDHAHEAEQVQTPFNVRVTETRPVRLNVAEREREHPLTFRRLALDLR